MGRRIVVENGFKINRLTVIREIESRKGWKGSAVRRLEAKCDCGDIRGYDTKNVYNGNTRSCGCYKNDRIKESNIARCTSHNESYSRLYSVWTNMNHRCGMGSTEGLQNYGADGIRVCDQWASSFEAFHEWAIGAGYSEGLQIDRKNNEAGYSPDNCRFVTAKINMSNRRNSLVYCVDGVVYESAHDAAKAHGVTYGAIHRRCRGYRKRGKWMPPKPNCWAERKYK